MNAMRFLFGAGPTLVLLSGLGVTGSVGASLVDPPLFVSDDLEVYQVNGTAPGEIKAYINSDFSKGKYETITGSLDKNNNTPTVQWTTTDTNGISAATGFAIIKGGYDSVLKDTLPITDLTFSFTDGSLFHDVEFSLDPKKNDPVSFRLTAYFSGGSQSWESSTKNGLEDFVMLAPGGNLFSSINIKILNGELGAIGSLEQTKQWAVSFAAPVPVPAAAWLFGSALLGVAGIGYRRQSNQA